MASAVEAGIVGTPVPLHPYSPVGVAIPEYAANTLSTPTIFAIFCGALAVVLVPAFVHIRRVRPDLPHSELATALWFVMCAAIHMVLEGYFALNFRDISSHHTVLGQLWKEYSLSDSRYLTRDSFVTCMEAVTALFWGPLSLAIAYTIVADHPLRHPLQTIVSLGQVYGDVLYLGIGFFQHSVAGLFYCRPEAVYFWVYFIGMNAVWLVIPGYLIFSSVKEMVRVASVAKAVEKGKKQK